MDPGRGGQLAFGAHAGGSDILRIGLVGCGGRGTGAAADALQADPNVQLVAMADLFEDRLKSSLASLQKDEAVGKKVAVTPERQFVGFDAYKQLIASGVDVVLLATPPHFRPMHLKAAVDAGLHVFAEKPVAVDAPGVRSVLATCEEAKKKNLSLVSGLCLRCSYAFRELVRRIHDGALGEIHTLQANDYRGAIWTKTRMPGETDMHWQTRNWYYYTWLSGDFNVEQHVHFLDVCAWIMKGRYPVRAIGMGGRQVRTGPQFGNIFDHHSVVYEYDDGAKLFSNTRQMAGCAGDMSAAAVGSKGRAIFAEAQGRGPDRRRRREMDLPRPGQQHLPHRTRRDVRRHSQGPADQQRRIHGQEHAAGDPRADGHLHRAGHHLGAGDELEGGPLAAQVRVGPAAGAARGHARHHALCLITYGVLSCLPWKSPGGLSAFGYGGSGRRGDGAAFRRRTPAAEPARAGQAHAVPNRLHDVALLPVPLAAGADGHPGGRLPLRGLGHHAQRAGRPADAGDGPRRPAGKGPRAGQAVPRPGPGAADDVLHDLSRGPQAAWKS